MTDRTPAQVFHPSEFIKDELEARGWSMEDLARRMPGDFELNYIALDFYLTLGADEPDLRLGDSTGIARAFGCSDDDYFSRLEQAWLAHRERAA